MNGNIRVQTTGAFRENSPLSVQHNTVDPDETLRLVTYSSVTRVIVARIVAVTGSTNRVEADDCKKSRYIYVDAI